MEVKQKPEFTRKIVVTDHNGHKIEERTVESDTFYGMLDEYNAAWDVLTKKYPGNRHYIFRGREEDEKR